MIQHAADTKKRKTTIRGTSALHDQKKESGFLFILMCVKLEHSIEIV